MVSIVLKTVGINKIEVIKIVRESTGLELKEAEDVVEKVEKGIPFEMYVLTENVDDILKALTAAGAVAINSIAE